jgi:alpha-beta hydrolase superfamily lysophospholipase
LSDAVRLRKVRKDFPIYLFSGSEDPAGQQLEGVKAPIERYRQAGLNACHDFYIGGRHEMPNEINRGEVLRNLVNWVSARLNRGRDRNMN